MAGFNLTAEINLRGPSNIRQVAANIRKQLQGITTDVNVKLNPQTNKQIVTVNKSFQQFNKTLQQTNSLARATSNSLRQLGSSTSRLSGNLSKVSSSMSALPKAASQVASANKQAAAATSAITSEFEEFGKQSALAVRRFAAFATVTGVIYKVSNAISAAGKDFIDFEKELVKVAQVSRTSISSLDFLVQNISKLSSGLGVASQDLVGVSRTLTQAGLTARDTSRALEALAKSALAPTFDDLNRTVEGSIALMKQFGIGANQLETALGSINAVAGQFAVEAGDIITAISRAGGVFASASNGVSQGTDALNEFIAVFTSVRATTRESAETIATGLRTIFTRIQREDTIEALKAYGIQLQDLEGKFVGPYEAVRRLAAGLRELDPRDIRFSRIVEDLGGFRQIGKVIPLIQQFTTAQRALTAAQEGGSSLARDAAIAQLSLANRITKVREEFVALVRSIGQSQGFRDMANLALDLTSGLIQLANAAKSALPALTAIFAIKGFTALTQFSKGFGKGIGRTQTANAGGYIHKFARGGVVPGRGNTDTVPAMLQPGEFVIRKKAVQTLGTKRLHAMNKYALGGSVMDYSESRPYAQDPSATPTWRKRSNQKFGEDQGRPTRFNPEDSFTFNKQEIPVNVNRIKGKSSEASRKAYYAAARTNQHQERGRMFEQVLADAGYLTLDAKLKGARGNARLDATSKSGMPAEIKSTAETIDDFNISSKMIGAALHPIGSVADKTIHTRFQGVTLTDQPNNFSLGEMAVYQDKTIIRSESGEELKRLGKLRKDQTAKQKKEVAAQEAAIGGYIKQYAAGGDVDTVPAMLTPGEFVINRKAARRIGSQKLHSLNKADKVRGYNKGGFVNGVQTFANGGLVDDVISGGGLSPKDAAMLQQAAKKNIAAFERLAKLTDGWPAEDVGNAFKTLSRQINKGVTEIDDEIDAIAGGKKGVKGMGGAQRDPSRQDRIKARETGVGANQGAADTRTVADVSTRGKRFSAFRDFEGNVDPKGLTSQGTLQQSRLPKVIKQAEQQISALGVTSTAQKKAMLTFTTTLRKTGNAQYAMMQAQNSLKNTYQTAIVSVSKSTKLFPTLGPAITKFTAALGKSRIGSMAGGVMGNLKQNLTGGMGPMLLATMGPMIGDALGSAMGGGATGAGVSSGVSSITGGVAAGAMFGPMGALVGGLAGAALAVNNFTNAVAQKEAELIGMKIDKAVEEGTKIRERFQKSRSEGDAQALAKNFKAIQDLESQRATEVQKANQQTTLGSIAETLTFGRFGGDNRTSEEKIAERRSGQIAGGQEAEEFFAAMNEAGYSLKQVQDAASAQGTSLEELSRAVVEAKSSYQEDVQAIKDKNSDVRTQQLQIKRLTNSMVQEEINSRKSAIVEKQRVIAAEKNRKALEKSTQILSASIGRTFDNLSQSINASMSRLDRASAELQEMASGGFTGTKVNLKALDVLQNPRAFSRQEQNAAIRQSSQFAGADRGFMERITRFSLDIDDIVAQSGARLQQAGADKEAQATVGQSIVNDVTGKLEAALGSNQLTNQIRNQFKTLLVKAMRPDNQEDVDIQALLEQSGLFNGVDILKNAVDLQIQSVTAVQKNLEFLSVETAKAAVAMQQVRDIRANTRNVITQSNIAAREALGKRVTLEDRASARLGTAATRAGVSSGQMNTGALTQRRDSLRTQEESLKKSLENLKQSFDSSSKQHRDRYSALNKKLRETQSSLQATEKALENLPQLIQENINDIISEIGRIAQEQEARQSAATDFASKLVGSTPQELMGLNQTFQYLNNTLNGQVTTIQQSQVAWQAYNQSLMSGATHQEAVASAQQAFASQTQNALGMFNELVQMSGLEGGEVRTMRADLMENFAKGQGMGLENNPFFKRLLEMMRADPGESEEIQALRGMLTEQQAQLINNSKELVSETLSRQESVLNAANNHFIQTLQNVRVKFDEAQLQSARAGISRPSQVVRPQGRAEGGIIYASTGTLVDYQPRGTDTVPAMLTPGEFVVNRQSTKKHLPLLHAINSDGYSDGGVIYASNGMSLRDFGSFGSFGARKSGSYGSFGARNFGNAGAGRKTEAQRWNPTAIQMVMNGMGMPGNIRGPYLQRAKRFGLGFAGHHAVITPEVGYTGPRDTDKALQAIWQDWYPSFKQFNQSLGMQRVAESTQMHFKWDSEYWTQKSKELHDAVSSRQQSQIKKPIYRKGGGVTFRPLPGHLIDIAQFGGTFDPVSGTVIPKPGGQQSTSFIKDLLSKDTGLGRLVPNFMRNMRMPRMPSMSGNPLKWMEGILETGGYLRQTIADTANLTKNFLNKPIIGIPGAASIGQVGGRGLGALSFLFGGIDGLRADPNATGRNRFGNMALGIATGQGTTMGDIGAQSTLGSFFGVEQGGYADKQLGNWSTFAQGTMAYTGTGVPLPYAMLAQAGAMLTQEGVGYGSDRMELSSARTTTRRMQNAPRPDLAPNLQPAAIKKKLDEAKESKAVTEKAYRSFRGDVTVADERNFRSKYEDLTSAERRTLAEQRAEVDRDREQLTGIDASERSWIIDQAERKAKINYLNKKKNKTEADQKELERLRTSVTDNLQTTMQGRESGDEGKNFTRTTFFGTSEHLTDAEIQRRVDEETRVQERILTQQQTIDSDVADARERRRESRDSIATAEREQKTYDTYQANKEAARVAREKREEEKLSKQKLTERNEERARYGLPALSEGSVVFDEDLDLKTRQDQEAEYKKKQTSYDKGSVASFIRGEDRRTGDRVGNLPPSAYGREYQNIKKERADQIAEYERLRTTQYDSDALFWMGPPDLDDASEQEKKDWWYDNRQKKLQEQEESIAASDQQMKKYITDNKYDVNREGQTELWAKHDRNQQRQAARQKNAAINRVGQQMSAMAKYTNTRVPDKFSNPEAFFAWRRNIMKKIGRDFPFGEKTEEVMRNLGLPDNAADAMFNPFSSEQLQAIYGSMLSGGGLSPAAQRLASALRYKHRNIDKEIEKNPAVSKIIRNASPAVKRELSRKFQSTFGKGARQVKQLNSLANRGKFLNPMQQNALRANMLKRGYKLGIIDPRLSQEENIRRLNAYGAPSGTIGYMYPGKQTANKALQPTMKVAGIKKPKKKKTFFASQGMLVPYDPQGTDTVPAMLTPGEFIVNRQSTKKHLSLLQSINKNKGGRVSYLQSGGMPDGSPNTQTNHRQIDGVSTTRPDELFNNVKNIGRTQTKDGKEFRGQFANVLGSTQNIEGMTTAIRAHQAATFGFAQGGPVYASNGMMVNYQPQGTDTVPAMLTPGEFVVNRQATQKNLPLLKAINSGAKGYANGGVVSDRDRFFAQLEAQKSFSQTTDTRTGRTIERNRDGTIVSDSLNPYNKDIGSADPLKAFGISAAKGVGPTAAGVMAGGYTTAATAPVLGPFAPLAGLAAGVAVGGFTSLSQEGYLDFFAPEANQEANRLAAEQPVASALGSAVPGVGAGIAQQGLRSFVGTLSQRLASGTFSAGLGAVMEYAATGEVDPSNVGLNAGLGFAQPGSGGRPRPATKNNTLSDLTTLGGLKEAPSTMGGQTTASFTAKPGTSLGNETTASRFAAKPGTSLGDQTTNAGTSQASKQPMLARFADRIKQLFTKKESNEDLWQPPEYLTKEPQSSLEEMLQQVAAQRSLASYRASSLLGGETGDPQALRRIGNILVEAGIDPRSLKSLGSGSEALVFDTGAGNVIKIGKTENRQVAGILGIDSKQRFDLPQGVPGVAGYTNKFAEGPYSVGVQPKLETLSPEAIKTFRSKNIAELMRNAFRKKGYEALDVHEHNVGYASDPDSGIPTPLGSLTLLDGAMKPINRKMGGIVYANNGMLVPYRPQGTDTVPAMLTPGEFVVNRAATQQHLPALQQMNRGGQVSYLQNGTDMGHSPFLSEMSKMSSILTGVNQAFKELQSSMNNQPNNARQGVFSGGGGQTPNILGVDRFSDAVNNLSNVTIPSDVNLNMAPANITVDLNGAGILQGMQQDVQNAIMGMIGNALNNWAAQNFDGIQGPFSGGQNQ